MLGKLSKRPARTAHHNAIPPDSAKQSLAKSKPCHGILGRVARSGKDVPGRPQGRGGGGSISRGSGRQGDTRGRESGRQGDTCGGSSESGSQGDTHGKRKAGMLGMHVDDAFEGLASETDKQHAARHPSFRPTCLRCVYSARRSRYERCHGSYKHSDATGLLATVWLASRPARFCGTFAVGCVFCAALKDRCAAESETAHREGTPCAKRRRGSNYARTKWASYEMRNVHQLAPRGLKQHAETAQHRRAIRAYFAPAAPITYRIGDQDDEDASLFKAGVPQVVDWVRGWRAATSDQSFSTFEKVQQTEVFIHGSRVRGAGRKALRAMTGVIARVLRRRKRKVLESATKVSLALDDRGDYRLIHFKCDADRPSTCDPKSWAGSVSGCLGVLRRGGNFEQKELRDVDEDYSREMAASVVRAIERLCGGNGAAATGICEKVVIGVADGGAPAQKCLKFLATGAMKNMLWAGRDRAHALRIATAGALTAEDHFRAWWEDVFNKQHALIPDIRNSDEWMSKLILCQKTVLGESGSQGGHCVAVQRVINFAKQRFDSMASPQRQFCVLLVAIAMLLAAVTSDWRAAKLTRDRARARLLEIPEQVTTIGLSASYSEEALIFVRGFDVGDHDPALTYSQRIDFLSRMQVLFLEGHIFEDVDLGLGGPGVQESDATLLAVALHQARNAAPIYYDGGKVLKLYRRLSPDQAMKVSDSIRAVVGSMSERVEVELSSDDLGVLFTCFDLTRWHVANQAVRQNAESAKMDLLQSQLRRMCRSWGFDGSQGVRELTSLALRLCGVEAKHLRSGKPRDNRVAWAQVLEIGFLAVNDSVIVALPMVKTYLVAIDSTCGVERDLGGVTRMLSAHAGPCDPNGDTIADLSEVLLDGPKSEECIGVRASGGSHESSLRPTNLCREFAQEWVGTHGRRFRVYALGERRLGRKPKPKPREGTMAALSRRTQKTMLKLGSRTGPADMQRRSVLGMPLGSFWRRPSTENPAKTSALLKKFDALTRRKAEAQRTLTLARSCPGLSNPYQQANIDPNKKLRLGRAFRGPQPADDDAFRRVGVGVSGRIIVLDFCSTALPGRDGYTVSRPASSVKDLINQLQRAHLVVMDSPWFLDNQGTPSRLGLAINMGVIALGKSVLPRARWLECRPLPAGPPAKEVVHFNAAMRLVPRSFALSAALQESNAWLCQFIETMVKLTKCTWKKVPEPRGASSGASGSQGVAAKASGSRAAAKKHPGKTSPASQQDVLTLTTLIDVRRFLLDVRRVWFAGTGRMGGKYIPPGAGLA